MAFDRKGVIWHKAKIISPTYTGLNPLRLKIFEVSADRMASDASRGAPLIDGCH